MTSRKSRSYLFGLDLADLRQRLLDARTSSALPAMTGPYACDKEVQRVFHNTWTLVHAWDYAARYNRRAPAGTAELATETLHLLHTEYAMRAEALAALFDIPVTRIYWYCSHWNYLHGTSREYAYRER